MLTQTLYTTKSLLLALMLLILVSHSVFAQKEKNGSFKKYNSRSTIKNSAADLLREANDLKNDNPKDALNKVGDALGTSLALGDTFNEGRSYELIAEINEHIQEWTLALENYTRAYEKLSTGFKTAPEFRRTLQGLGNTNLKLRRYDDALRYFQEALTLRLDQTERMDRWLDVSEVYYQMGNYDESLKALDNVSTTKVISNSIDRVQSQQAKIYARKNELEKTKELYQNSLNAPRASGSEGPKQEEALQNAKEDIAEVLHEQKRYDDEIDLRKQSIERNIRSNNFSEVSKDKIAIGKTLAAKGENKAALRTLEEATMIADTLDNPKEQANAFLALANQYERNGNKDLALYAYKKYSQAVDNSNRRSEIKRIEKSSLLDQQNDINELSKTVSIGLREYTIEQGTLFRQQLIIYGLLAIIAIIAVTSYFIYKNAQASKIANQLLALKSLRSQMNPHFIFNALNSVNHFIAQQDERTANRFLSEFSQLMRLVMENSQEDFIPLEREQEILSIYLKLEHYRFRDKFSYEVNVDESIAAEGIEVPPMLIQPYLENAVWHGLRYKEDMGKLSLSFKREGGDLIIEIIDDGIGRVRSGELKTENQKKHHSTGLKNIQERLAIINKVYKKNYRVFIDDLINPSGTRVRIHLPVNFKKP